MTTSCWMGSSVVCRGEIAYHSMDYNNYRYYVIRVIMFDRVVGGRTNY